MAEVTQPARTTMTKAGMARGAEKKGYKQAANRPSGARHKNITNKAWGRKPAPNAPAAVLAQWVTFCLLQFLNFPYCMLLLLKDIVLKCQRRKSLCRP